MSKRDHASAPAASGSKKGKKVFDKKKVRCYNCNKFGHFASECRAPKSTKDTVANVVDGAYSFMGEFFHHSAEDRLVWYADNGATDHMTYDDSLFVSYTNFDEPKPVRVGNNSVMQAYGSGRIDVEMCVNGKWTRTFLSNVWYVPELGVNLFSLIVAEMKGYSICAENSQIKLVHNDVVVVDECVSRLGLVC